MTNSLIFDFARVLLFAKDRSYKGELNALHRTLSATPEYKFFDHFEFNEELFIYLEQLKEKFDLFMFTSGTIQEIPEIKFKIDNLFREVYSAQKLGITKTEPSAYLKVVELTGRDQEEIIYIDDAPVNILAAQRAQIQTILYSSNLQLRNDLKNLLNLNE